MNLKANLIIHRNSENQLLITVFSEKSAEKGENGMIEVKLITFTAGLIGL